MEPLAETADVGGFVATVSSTTLAAREIVNSFQVRRPGGGQPVDGHFLATVGPHGITGDLREHLEAVHELDARAGLESLPRIDVARPAMSSAANPPPGNWP